MLENELVEHIKNHDTVAIIKCLQYHIYDDNKVNKILNIIDKNYDFKEYPLLLEVLVNLVGIDKLYQCIDIYSNLEMLFDYEDNKFNVIGIKLPVPNCLVINNCNPLTLRDDISRMCNKNSIKYVEECPTFTNAFDHYVEAYPDYDDDCYMLILFDKESIGSELGKSFFTNTYNPNCSKNFNALIGVIDEMKTKTDIKIEKVDIVDGVSYDAGMLTFSKISHVGAFMLDNYKKDKLDYQPYSYILPTVKNDRVHYNDIIVYKKLLKRLRNA